MYNKKMMKVEKSYCQDEVAVVTGAGGTLCSSIAVDLARQGAKVVLIGRTASKLEKTAAEIAAAGGVCRIETGEAPELLGCVNWLLDDSAAGFVTGTTVPVDGGFLASAGV